MDLKELDSGVDPTTHWYYQAKRIPLLRFVRETVERARRPLTIVDVGAGSGFFAQELERRMPSAISKIHLVDRYPDEEIAATAGRRIEKRRELPPSLEDAIVVMMDVLEHLPDDLGMLETIRRRAVGANHFFITVPAFMGLWSAHDVFLGHCRRYTRTTLSDLLARARYAPSSAYYIYGSIFPLALIARRCSRSARPRSDMRPVHSLANRLLKGVCSLEMRLARVNRLAGLTCVAEGRLS